MLASGCAMLTGCGGNNSYREPQDAIDGYAVQVRFDKWNLVDIDGKDAFGGKTITSDDGEKYDGSLLSFKSSVSASVNGFYKIGNYSDGYTLLSKELDSDGKLVRLGPYRYVGMFYEDITPAVKRVRASFISTVRVKPCSTLMNVPGWMCSMPTISWED